MLNDFFAGDAVPPEQLIKLHAPFPPSDIDWKPGAVTKDKKKGLAMAYVTARAIQDRFDTVCGPHNWRVKYREVIVTKRTNSGVEQQVETVMCGIAVKTTNGWITKWDGAPQTDVESVKGGISSSYKRAASAGWGVGRYLYRAPSPWVALDARGRFTSVPRLPKEFLPEGYEEPVASPPEGRLALPSREEMEGRTQPLELTQGSAEVAPTPRSAFKYLKTLDIEKDSAARLELGKLILDVETVSKKIEQDALAQIEDILDDFALMVEEDNLENGRDAVDYIIENKLPITTSAQLFIAYSAWREAAGLASTVEPL